MKKKVLGYIFAIAAAAIFSGCATNFATWGDWKTDKKGEYVAAQVIESKVTTNGYIEGTAKTINGDVVNFLQKPYFTATTPFNPGVMILIRQDEIKK